MTHGCHNRPPLKTRAIVQDGWYSDGTTRTPRMIAIPDPMSKDCQYTQHAKSDPSCIGCCHKYTQPATLEPKQ